MNLNPTPQRREVPDMPREDKKIELVKKTFFYPNILLVEDSEADATLIKTQLSSIWKDVRVHVVESLSDAYEVYKLEKLDLILLDLNLPDGFGPKSVEEALSFIRKIPVVVITGMESMMMMNEALKYGAKGVIFKNKIMTDEFKQVLTGILS